MSDDLAQLRFEQEPDYEAQCREYIKTVDTFYNTILNDADTFMDEVNRQLADSRDIDEVWLGVQGKLARTISSVRDDTASVARAFEQSSKRDAAKGAEALLKSARRAAEQYAGLSEAVTKTIQSIDTWSDILKQAYTACQDVDADAKIDNINLNKIIDAAKAGENEDLEDVAERLKHCHGLAKAFAIKTLDKLDKQPVADDFLPAKVSKRKAMLDRLIHDGPKAFSLHDLAELMHVDNCTSKDDIIAVIKDALRSKLKPLFEAEQEGSINELEMKRKVPSAAVHTLSEIKADVIAVFAAAVRKQLVAEDSGLREVFITKFVTPIVARVFSNSDTAESVVRGINELVESIAADFDPDRARTAGADRYDVNAEWEGAA